VSDPLIELETAHKKW